LSKTIDGRRAFIIANRELAGARAEIQHGYGIRLDRCFDESAYRTVRIAEPVFFIHAENDYSLSSGKVLDARREHIGKPHRLKIYPPIGHTVDDGHDFLHLGVNIWAPDVFAFLDENMRK
jgi:pimeloyl-ACP methyl ester carboxylesterase